MEWWKPGILTGSLHHAELSLSPAVMGHWDPHLLELLWGQMS